MPFLFGGKGLLRPHLFFQTFQTQLRPKGFAQRLGFRSANAVIDHDGPDDHALHLGAQQAQKGSQRVRGGRLARPGRNQMAHEISHQLVQVRDLLGAQPQHVLERFASPAALADVVDNHQ